MKKIKKFKVNLHKREIIHNFKTISNIKQITDELEELIVKEIEKSSEYLFPASMFDTFSQEAAIKNFGMSFDNELQVIGVSLIVVTIGDEIEKQLKVATQQGEQIRVQLLNAIGIEACNSSLNFIYKLITEEANKEEYSLMPVEKIKDEFAKEIIKKFNTKRIGVYIDDKNQIQPEYTVVATAKWVPAKKPRR